jgi:hypothetical protein
MLSSLNTRKKRARKIPQGAPSRTVLVATGELPGKINRMTVLLATTLPFLDGLAKHT